MAELNARLQCVNIDIYMYIKRANKYICHFVAAFSTIAWDDLEDCASVVRQDRDSLGSQVSHKRLLFFSV